MVLRPGFENVRMASFNYKPAWDSFFVMEEGKDSTMEKIDELSTNLCKAVSNLQRDRIHPVVFIAHCVGGLVCANIVAQRTRQSGASQPGPFEIIARRCKGLIFLATPFCGDNIDDWTTIIKKMCPKAKAEMNLQSGPVRVHQIFQSQLLQDRYSNFRVDNLVEVGNEDSSDIIVTADYADLRTVTPVGFLVSHRSISKCADRLVFDHIVETLEDIMNKIPGKDKSTDKYGGTIAMASPQDLHHPANYHATVAHARIVPSPLFNKPHKGSQEDSASTNV
ncbi:hypothetical protein B0J14DRAFT_168106 [Halenospora varia]|nr:hypothetical protein B0J14DRAFT_168106 [Halenospora varia]